MERGPEQGCFYKPAMSLFISDKPGQEEASRRECAVEGLVLNFVTVIRYLGAYPGKQEELVLWVKPQVESWEHGVRVLVEINQRHPQPAYAGLGMLLQLEWQHLQRTVP